MKYILALAAFVVAASAVQFKDKIQLEALDFASDGSNAHIVARLADDKVNGRQICYLVKAPIYVENIWKKPKLTKGGALEYLSEEIYNLIKTNENDKRQLTKDEMIYSETKLYGDCIDGLFYRKRNIYAVGVLQDVTYSYFFQYEYLLRLKFLKMDNQESEATVIVDRDEDLMFHPFSYAVKIPSFAKIAENHPQAREVLKRVIYNLIKKTNAEDKKQLENSQVVRRSFLLHDRFKGEATSVTYLFKERVPAYDLGLVQINENDRNVFDTKPIFEPVTSY